MKTQFYYRKILIIGLTCLVSLAYSQENNQISDEPFAYQVNGIVPVFKFNNEYVKPSGVNFFLGNYNYNIVGKYQVLIEGATVEYVLLKLQGFKYKVASAGLQKYSDSTYLVPKEPYQNKKKYKPYISKKTPSLVDIEDQDEVFVIQSSKFEYQLNEGFIRKKYEVNKMQFDWGASLTIPFKIRPTIDDINMKITPELSLGGFFGMKKRLSRYKPHFWYIPIITAGVTIIGVNKDNIIVEQDVSNVKDGLIFARTISAGTVIELDGFQMGFVFGWDKPGGEIAKDWIYNDRLWYSFTIGFDFLNKNDDSE